MRQIFSVIYFLCCIVVLTGCATVTAPVYAKKQDNNQNFKSIISGKKVFIMQPFIKAVSTETETPVAFESCGASALSDRINNYIGKIGQEAGAAVIIYQKDVAFEGRTRDAIQKLEANVPMLMSYYKNKSELFSSLQAVAETTDTEIIGVYSILVKVGQGAGWDPNSGRIWQGTSSTSVKAVLISPADGKVLWGNEVFVRALASDGRCIETVEPLFSEIQ